MSDDLLISSCGILPFTPSYSQYSQKPAVQPRRHAPCAFTRKPHSGMKSEIWDSSATHRGVEVTLDGQLVEIPLERRSLNAIRSYLEALALEYQRILCSFSVDGAETHLAQSASAQKSFTRVEGKTISLERMPLQLIETAMHQVSRAREQVHSAVALIMINDGHMAREFWWTLTKDLKSPLLTLSLVPESDCGPANGRASLSQLRRWQLQQLASLIKLVDEACWSENANVLSNALENHVLNWLDSIQESLELWHETVAAGVRVGRYSV